MSLILSASDFLPKTETLISVIVIKIVIRKNEEKMFDFIAKGLESNYSAKKWKKIEKNRNFYLLAIFD